MSEQNEIINKISATLNTKVETIEKYIKKFKNKYFVIKYGGHAMGNEALSISFAEDVSILDRLGIKPVIVHGGGPQIGAMLKKLNIETKFIEGLRVTNEETVKIVEMVLSGSINGLIGKLFNKGKIIEIEKIYKKLKDKFKNDFYIEIQRHGDPNERSFELLKGQKKYMCYRAEKDPARGMLRTFFGELWTESYINNILFDLK